MNKNGKDLGTFGSMLDVLAYAHLVQKGEEKKERMRRKRKNEQKIIFEEIMIS